MRRETGKEWKVKVRYDEGIATHIAPEPCVGIREDVDEASVGEHAGQPLSRESYEVPDADTVEYVEGNTGARVIEAMALASLIHDGAHPDADRLSVGPCASTDRTPSLRLFHRGVSMGSRG